ncbi:uncharacterized protein LOC115892770 [Rhinopithecus roxellana]|uniref:uncharacterized protein LOC115892770 n=1 Tax=Rhinopithecus roxellana TaxID=61622 RepID=UPI0012374D8D|nr:uncharacterized protein LOC115892770 [Rhinopithecus roxellana]
MDHFEPYRSANQWPLRPRPKQEKSREPLASGGGSRSALGKESGPAGGSPAPTHRSSYSRTKLPHPPASGSSLQALEEAADRFRYSGVLTQPIGIRKGFLREKTPSQAGLKPSPLYMSGHPRGSHSALQWLGQLTAIFG